MVLFRDCSAVLDTMVSVSSTFQCKRFLSPHNAPLACSTVSYSHRLSRHETPYVTTSWLHSQATTGARRLSCKSTQYKPSPSIRNTTGNATSNKAILSGSRIDTNSHVRSKTSFTNGAASSERVSQGAISTTSSNSNSHRTGADGASAMRGDGTRVKAAASDATGGDAAADGQVFAVTGATGFLGSHLLQQLLAAGHTVRCLCRQPNTLPPHPKVEVVIGSLSDPSSLDNLLQGTSGLFHLAGIVIHSRAATSAPPPPPQQNPDPTSPPQPNSTAQNPSLDQTTVDGTLAVLEAALKAGVKRVVYASTSGTVGAFKEPRFVASDSSPYAREVVGGWPYYRAKIEAEERARGYAEQHGLELVCMRPTLILGPGDYRLSSCRTVLDIMERRIPFVPRGGLSFVDVRDVASAFIAAMQCPSPNPTYLLGAVNMTLSDYFQLIARCADVAPPWLSVPPRVAWVLAATASKLLPLIGRKDPSLDPVVVEMAQVYWYIDWSWATKELGFTPRPYETTVADTVAWLKEHREQLRD
ncbi:unnamed protein product [Closterium sp. Yama58-4]|nr:unnamed protein product [Closterium sp. Yama58-4]